MEACVDGRLDTIDLQFEDNAAVCVVLASDGYPVSYEKDLKSAVLKSLMEKTTISVSMQERSSMTTEILLQMVDECLVSRRPVLI